MKLTRPVILNEVKDPASFSPASILLDSSASPQNDRYRGFVRMFVPVLLALCSLLLAPCSKATELTDLGSGLAYLRIHSLAESEAALRKAVPGASALVLDLRYATTDENSVAALKSALASHPAGAPLFILVSPATSAALAQVVASALTLGAPGSVPAPKVMVQTDATTDRRAYDALETGTALEILISGKIEKERFDEATLVHEFKNGNPDAAPLPGDRPGQTPAGQQAGTVSPLPDPTAPKPAGTPEKPAPLVDRVLQRAVHLHRALLALKAR